jgi:hypothetical protein
LRAGIRGRPRDHQSDLSVDGQPTRESAPEPADTPSPAHDTGPAGAGTP